jgi:hypothetical protein
MKKIFYEKQGRKYVPVYEYDSDFLSALPKGSHLIMIYPGGSSTRYNVDPNYAAMIAAGRVAEDAMCAAIREASEMRPQRAMLTEGQHKAWKKLAKEFGDDLATLSIKSSHDIAEAGLTALREEADKLMKNASVREAYNQFIMMCELCKDHDAEVR